MILWCYNCGFCFVWMAFCECASMRKKKKTFFWFYLSKYNKLEPTDEIQKDVYGKHKYFFFMWARNCYTFCIYVVASLPASHNQRAIRHTATKSIMRVCAIYYPQRTGQINKNDRYFWLSIKFNKFLRAQMILSV